MQDGNKLQDWADERACEAEEEECRLFSERCEARMEACATFSVFSPAHQLTLQALLQSSSKV